MGVVCQVPVFGCVLGVVVVDEWVCGFVGVVSYCVCVGFVVVPPAYDCCVLVLCCFCVCVPPFWF